MSPPTLTRTFSETDILDLLAAMQLECQNAVTILEADEEVDPKLRALLSDFASRQGAIIEIVMSMLSKPVIIQP